MTSAFSWQNSVSLCPAFISYSKAKFACYSRCFLTSYFCTPVPYNERDIFWGCQFQKVLQVFIEAFIEASQLQLQLQLLQHYWFGHAATSAKLLQSCPTLCDPIDGSPPGSPVPGILQASILEWVAISFSNARKQKMKVKSFSRVQLLATPWTAADQAPPSMRFSSQEYWSGVPLPSPRNVVHGSNLKNDRMIFVHFQCKPFNIIAIQVVAPYQ